MGIHSAAKKEVSSWKKLGETLICIFIGAGVMYFYELLKNFTPDKADQLFLIFGFGITYAFFMNYDLNSLIKKRKK